jgi:hypothetical protein
LRVSRVIAVLAKSACKHAIFLATRIKNAFHPMHFHTWDERPIYRSALPPILPHLFLRLLFFACDHFIAYHKGYEPVAFTTSLRKWTNCFLIPAHTSRQLSELFRQS